MHIEVGYKPAPIEAPDFEPPGAHRRSTVPKETTLKGKLGDLLRLLSSLNANTGDLPHLEVSRAQLAEMVARAQEAADRQALFTAGKQEASQDLRASVTEGQRLANILRLAVKQHYGIRAEKLAQFGLQPFRGRAPRKAKPAEEPQPTTPQPKDPATQVPADPIL
jgi:hypothetical protein